MAPTPGKRFVAALTAATLTALGVGALVPSTASAATTSLFNQPFHNATANGDGPVVLPKATGNDLNAACLTAAGNTTTIPKSCTTTPTDAVGSGKLRLTDDSTYKVGGLFAATSVPTVSGLDLTFNTYQYGNRTDTAAADGIAFALAAVDPTSPTAPANIGPNGGSLGYSATNSGTTAGYPGLAYGYLGVGFDVYGNFSNNRFQGLGCTNPAYIANNTQVKSQVIVRGPGNSTSGYCALASTATGTTSQTAVPLRATTRDASRVPVEVVINPASSSITSPSGITVAAKSYAVQFTPVGAAGSRTLSGALPTVASGLYPSTWVDSSGYPKQLAFGWVGSTGGSQDAHELDNVKVVSLSAVPELTVSQTAYTASTPAAGDPVSYVVRAGVDVGVDETSPVSVTDTLPTGVTPTGGYGSGWTCAAPVGQKITCTSSTVPVKAGAALPSLTITGTVTGSNVTAATIQSNSIVTASSNDANPAYSNVAAAGSPTSAPSSLAISPASGPIGSSVTITGTNTANATAVQVGTAAEIAAGTATTLSPCANNAAATGCFTINATTGAIGISSMPTHANAAVQVKVVTLGAAASVGFTYTSVPGTPAVTATAGVQTATATWTAPASGGSDVTGYTVTPYKDGVAQTPVSLAATVTTYTVGNATPGSSYTFTVSAKNANGTGVTSTQSNAVVPYTLPGAPTIGTATAATGSARLSWTAPASNGYSAVTGYVVTPYLNGTAQSPQTFTSAATTQTVTGLTAGGSYTFTVAAVNAAGTGPASARSTAVTVNDVPTITSTPSNGEVGVAYDHQFAVRGGTAGYSFAVTDGTLPAGLSLSSAGIVSGTPTTAGSSTFTVRVTDSSGVSTTKAFTVVVAAPVSLTFTSSLPATTVGAAYSQPLAYAGGTGPYTFSLSTGSLPAGLSLNTSTGVVSGTATRSGDSSFTVKVVDAFGQSDTRAAALSVRAVPGGPTLGTVSAGTSAATVRWTAPTDDGNSPITGYVVTPYLDGVAQTPLTAGATAVRLVVTGLTAGSSYTFTVAAVNAIGTGPATAQSPEVVPNPGPSITTVPGNGEVGVAYSQQLTSVGGTGASDYAITSGTLPDGLTLSATGLISGTPTTAASSSFRVQVTDDDGLSSSRLFTVVVAARPALTFDTAQPAGTVGAAYSQPLGYTGGTGPFTFAVSAGSLPAGLTLDPATGVVSGTPTTSGASAVTVKITDALGQSDTRAATLAVRGVPTAPTAPTVTAGTGAARVSWSAPADDGGSPVTGYVVTPYIGSVAQTPVPFSSTATTQTVTGLTPGTAYTFTVAAVNAIGTGPASPRSAEIAVNGAPAISSTPAQGEVGAASDQQLAVSGGTGPFAFTLTDGTLPAGLSLSSGGVLSGTPTAAGSSTVTVEVTDSYGASSTRTLTLVVVAAPSLTYGSPLADGTVGTPYSQTLTRTGGTGPFAFSVSAGTLPAGLVLDASTGVLSGTPTRSGDSTFTVKVVDALGQGDTRSTTVSVRTVAAAPTITSVTAGTTTATLVWSAPSDDGNSAVTGYVVTPYLNGVAQATFTYESTATTQTLMGLAAGGPYTFTVAAVNGVGTGPGSSRSTAVTVNPRPSITGAPGGGEVGVAYDQQLVGTGGTGALGLELASGTLPDGLALSASGRITGTPTDAGSFTFRARVTDATGASSSRSFTVVVVAAPTLTFDAGLPATDVGAAYSTTLTHDGGTGPFSFAVTAGALPDGLALDPATGVVSGTATTRGDHTFSVTITDALGQTDTRAATLAVRAVPAAPAIGAATASTAAAVVRWTAPTDDGNSPVTGYVVTPYVDGAAQTPVTAGATATRVSVPGLTPGTTYTFTVAAVNAVGTGPVSAQSTTVVPNAGPVITNGLRDGEVSVAYSRQLTDSGGTGDSTYTVSSGTLPDGLTLSSAGLLAGTPTAAGSFTFRVRVTDATGATSTKGFTVVVTAAPALTFDSGLPDAERGKAYSTDLSRSGGTGPFTYTVSAGTLPAGLTLDAGTGTLSGTPTRGGSYAFTVTLVDALGASDTEAATLLVRAPADVVLAVSDPSVGAGGSVRLTATLSPSSSTGTVTFTAAGPGGVAVDLGSSAVSNGVASVRPTLTAFGRYTVTAVYAGDATHLGASSATQTVEVAAVAGQVVITEFRTSGPAGAEDSYAEIYNPGSPVPLAGFTLLSGSGAKTVLPGDAPVLGQHRTYLVGGRDFSLDAFATPDLTGSLGTGGLQLVAPDTAATVTDAVGPASGLHLGGALPTLSGTPTAQWAFVRTEKAGRPVNTASNGADFALVSSDGGKVGGVQSMRGSASPTGLGDDWQHDEQAQSSLLDPSVGAEAVPNRPYVVGRPGTLEIRRTITNTGTSTMTSAKARVTALSEANGLAYHGSTPPAVSAAIRAVNPKTATSTAVVPGRGTVTVQNLKVDAPITAAAGGGLNSTFTLPLPAGGLAPGASVDVAFTFEVDVRGTFWFGYDVDARTADQSAARTGGTLQPRVSAKTVERRLAASGRTQSAAVAPVVRGTL